eukprot:TRINITY_DN221_c0_g1_i1.p1 TRINITY_DN221_c0_g1~~TRINITY_DN221_c0_g1_i1.p1  ORF type:complete len:133 (+),score=18.27 TRINITY_DN221_c0_g1_i1:30-428(+)
MEQTESSAKSDSITLTAPNATLKPSAPLTNEDFEKFLDLLRNGGTHAPEEKVPDPIMSTLSGNFVEGYNGVIINNPAHTFPTIHVFGGFVKLVNSEVTSYREILNSHPNDLNKLEQWCVDKAKEKIPDFPAA